MDSDQLPTVLRQRLGDAGAVALVDLLDTGRDDVMKLVTDQFERRLNRECDAIRGEMAGLRGELRGEMAELRGELRGEMTVLRGEMAALKTELRTDMKDLRAEMRSDFRVELANARADLLKWSVVFWAGQMAATVALVVALR